MSKLSYEDKINLYNDRQKGMSINSLVSKYGIRHEGIEYLIRLINKHGFDVLRTVKNKYYFIEEKERIVNRVLLNKEALNSVAIDEGLASKGILQTWISKYKENGYNIVERKRGRPTMNKKEIKSKKNETLEEENERLKKENLYLAYFDHWIKEILKVIYYFRYCDDITILGSSKEELHEWLLKI